MKKTIGLLALLFLFGGAEAIAQSDMKELAVDWPDH